MATFLIVLAAGGVFTLISRTVSFGATTSNQFVASYLAQEGVEIVRNIRDGNFLRVHKGVTGANWKDGIDVPSGLCSGGCKADYNDSVLNPAGASDKLLRNGVLWSYDSGTPTIFQRKITVSNVTATKLLVTIEVSWEERGNTRKVTAVSELYNWLTP